MTILMTSIRQKVRKWPQISAGYIETRFQFMDINVILGKEQSELADLA